MHTCVCEREGLVGNQRSQRRRHEEKRLTQACRSCHLYIVATLCKLVDTFARLPVE